jgi:hypothetical protein
MFGYGRISRGAQHYLTSVCDHGCSLDVTLTSHLQKRCVYLGELYMDPAYMSVNGTDNTNCPLKGMDCNGLLNFQYDVIRVQYAFLPVSFTT